MDMTIRFPGGEKVDADYNGFTMSTDQPIENGGGGTAPEPFSLFLASMGTCIGIYVLRFCQERNIPTTELSMTLRFERNTDTQLISQIPINIYLPKEFPKKYHSALLKAANLCAVKKHLDQPPTIDMNIIQE